MPDLKLTLKGDNRDLVQKLDQVDKAIDKLDDATSLGQFAKGAAVAKARLEELKATAERLGDQATPELRKEIERLEDSFNKGFSTGKKRIGELADEIGDTREAARALGGDTFDLQDVFQAAFPKAAGNVALLASSIGVAAAALEGLGKAVDFVRKEFEPLNAAFAEELGLGARQATALGAALHDITHPLDLIQGKSEAWNIALSKAREDWGFLIGQTEEAAGAQEKLTKFTEAHEAALKRVADEQKKVNDELQKATLGFSFDEINAEVKDLTKQFQLLQSLGLAETGKHAEALRDRARQLDEKLKGLGDSVGKVVKPEDLEGFKELKTKLLDAADAQEKAEKSAKALADAQAPLQGAIKKTTQSLEDEAEALRKVRAEALKNQGDLLAQAADIQERIEEATNPDTSGIAKLRAEISKLKDEEAELANAGTQNESVWQRQAELFDLIAEKTAELRKREREGSGIDTEALKKAQNDFRKLLDAAAADIAGLPDSARGAAENIIERFRSINDAAGVSALDVRDFKLEFAGAMATARLEVGKLEDQAKVMLDTITELMKKFEQETVGVAEKISDALRSGPLAQFKEILAAIEAITKATPVLADAVEEAF